MPKAWSTRALFFSSIDSGIHASMLCFRLVRFAGHGRRPSLSLRSLAFNHDGFRVVQVMKRQASKVFTLPEAIYGPTVGSTVLKKLLVGSGAFSSADLSVQ